MEMTSKEIAIIKAAVKSRNKSKVLQPILFAILVVVLLAMLFGALSGDEFSALALPLLFITILLPQLGGSAKYHELVDILEKR
jgi:ABC-type transport system involved in cytochrome c biogenesis permease component